MNRTITSLTLLFLSFSFSIRANEAVFDYIDKYSIIAIQEMERTGIPASIKLAQGIIESKFGTSGLAKNANNHFGIKCKGNWQGGTFHLKDDDYVNGRLVKSCFRTYDSPEDSFYDHSVFLLQNRRYAFLFELGKTDYKAWAKGLKKAGYATAKHYARTLITTIEKYKLYKFDRNTYLIATKQELTPPQAISIADYNSASIKPELKVSEATETLISAPTPIAIPINYKAGDGLKNKSTKKNKSHPTFEALVYGNTSSQYLDEMEGGVSRQ